MMKASVVIRTFNSERTIGDVLRSLRNQSFGDFEIIVVDSGSTDGTLDIVREYPHVFVDYSPNKFTYSGSLNAGCSAARGEYIVCLSSHCVPLHSEWLGRLVGALDSDEQLASAWGPLIFDLEDYSTKRGGVELVSLKEFLHRPNQGLQNANGIIRRRLWEERPFSTKVRRCEDQDWAYDYLRRGYRTAIVHGAPVHYRFVPDFYRFALKTYRDSVALYELFGHETRVPTAELWWRLKWRFRAIIRGKKSLSTSKLAVASLFGRWAASILIRLRKNIRAPKRPL